MTEQQIGKPRKKPGSPGKVALIGAAATALGLFNIMSGSEEPSQAIAGVGWVSAEGA
jgi:hypothetical protein